MVNESSCESCGEKTKELFEKGSKWVCKNCKKPSSQRGYIVESRPPIGLGRGRKIMARALTLCQSPHPDGDSK